MMKTAPFAISTLCLLLSACGGGSNTINENPVPSVTDDSVVACTTNCVTVVLDETPIQNVNFSCGSARGITDNLGAASCPVDAQVTYFLKAKAGAKRINLGTTRKISAVDKAQGIVRVTMKDLAENINATSINTTNDSGFNTAVNLSRFLYSLNNGTYIESAPLNRIVINDAARQAVEKIEKDINASDFKDDTYIAKVQPMLTELGKSLIGKDVATSRLLRTLTIANSGTTVMTPDTGAISFGNVISGSTNDGENFVTLATYSAINRAGKNFGFGAHWIGNVGSDPSKVLANQQLVYIRNNFTKIDYQSGTIDPISRQLSNYSYKFSDGTFANSLINFTGKLFNDAAIVYNTDQLKVLIGQDPTTTQLQQLGKWQQNTAPVYQGNTYLTKGDRVNTFFDTDVWKVKESVEAGKQYYFPLYLKFKISNASDYLKVCKSLPVASQPVDGCVEAQTVPLVILENGDIYTAFAKPGDDNCGVLNTDTLEDNRGVKQYAVGTVRSTRFDSQSAKYIFPYLIFNGDKFRQMGLDGLVMGSNGLALRTNITNNQTASASIFKINLAGLDNRTNINATLTDSPASNIPPQWINIYNYYTRLLVTLSEASDSKTLDIPVVNELQKANAENYGGNFSVQTSECYTYPIK